MIGIRLKIILIIILCTFIFGGATAYYSIENGVKLLEKQTTSLIFSDTNGLANKIKSENNKIESTVSTVAALMTNGFDLEMAKSSKDYLQGRVMSISSINADLLKRGHKNGSGIMSIYATFNVETFKEVFETWHTVQNDEVVLMEPEPLELFDNPESPDMAWYFNPVKEKRGVWTTAYLDALTKIPMYSYVEPAIDNSGNIIAVVGMDISLEGVSKFVSNQKTINNGFSFLMDRDNEFIVAPRQKINQPLLDSLLVAKETKTEGIVYDENAIIAFSQLPNKQVVATHVNRFEILKEIYALRSRLVLFTLLMIIISVFLSFLLVAPIVSKINKLREATTAGGDKRIIDSIAKNYFKDEISQLALAFGQIFEEVKSAQSDLEKSNSNLEKRVQERTTELEQKVMELEKFSKLTVDRELKMVEMKERIRKLSEKQ